MNLFDVLIQYRNQLSGYGLKTMFVISNELKKVQLPFSKQGQLEILDLITIYFFRRFEDNNGIHLRFNLETNNEKCIIVIKSETECEVSDSSEVQEFFWFMHLIFRDILSEKQSRVWGIYKQNKFKVSKFKGEVVLSGTNPVILLSPYFFPLLTFLLLLIGFLITNLLNHNLIWFVTIVLVGFSLMLHIVMTLKSLMVKQSDIKSGGYFFSLIVIYFLFLFLISGIIIFVLQGSMETFSFYNLLFIEIKKSFYLFQAILFNLE